MDERSPATALYGLAMTLGGFILLLCATGVVPVGDGFFNAPPWIMVPVALLITAGGAYMLAVPFTTDAQRANFGAALALAFILRPRHRCDRDLCLVARAHEAAAALERLD
ncbi:MAG TPA: hypothetical protein VE932_09395 [Patescibacteria group bacterium]|nr:hypothetical protein [Patescibacteria group bacterium]